VPRTHWLSDWQGVAPPLASEPHAPLTDTNQTSPPDNAH
jgi:hypothetical protein